jgi:putative acetyltransferase
MAVLPNRQRQGIGSALVQQGLAVLKEQNHQIVIVLDHRDYYPRFGFGPALEHGIRWEHEVDPVYFMVLELQPGALANASGVVQYLPEFSEV